MIDHGPGDAARYPCPKCDAELLLAELLGHVEAQHPKHKQVTDWDEPEREWLIL